MRTLFSPPEQRSDLAKALIGFLSTATIALGTKLIVLMFASDSASQVVLYFVDNFPFWVQLITTSGAGGFFAVKWTEKNK